jgi:hypothetical protein
MWRAKDQQESVLGKGVARWISSSVAVALLLGVPARALAAPPDEEAGLTLEVGTQLGITQTRTGLFASHYPYGSAYVTFDEVEFGVGLPSLSLGGWISSRLALGGRLTNIWFVPDKGEIQNGFVGAELKIKVHSAVVLAGGLGVQIVGDTPGLNDGSSQEVGAGATLRAAFLPWRVGDHALGFTIEAIPGVVDESFTYSLGAGLTWFLF